MKTSIHFHKPKPIPLVMSVVSVLLLFGLCLWQLDRLSWKEDLISKIEKANANIPLQTLPKDLASHRFYRVQLEGEYLAEPEFHLAARYFEGQLGYSIINPFRLSDGQIVMVSRGWIPADKKEYDLHPAAPIGKRTILAQIRTSNERNTFTPLNQPERNVWFGRDALEMGAHANLKVVEVTLDIIGEQDRSILPVPTTGKIKLRNDHLQYAIIWFCIGVTALIISLLYHRKKPE